MKNGLLSLLNMIECNPGQKESKKNNTKYRQESALKDR